MKVLILIAIDVIVEQIVLVEDVLVNEQTSLVAQTATLTMALVSIIDKSI